MTMNLTLAPAAPHRPLLAGLGHTLRNAVLAFGNASNGARCMREVERLSALSDGELARRGLSRDGIVRHAFAPFFYN